MFWLVIILVMAAVLCWLLISPLRLEIDTRVPRASLSWFSIAAAQIWYDKEWWFRFRVLFFQKTIRLEAARSGSKTLPRAQAKPGRRKHPRFRFRKIIRLLRTFRVRQWTLAIDTGDFVRNGQLYALNFAPSLANHLFINFSGESYLVLVITNRPWKIIYAFLRR
jgi:hypothetical protein